MWGRAERLQGEEMQQQGSGFSYSHEVTVTSGHDAEIKFLLYHTGLLQREGKLYLSVFLSAYLCYSRVRFQEKKKKNQQKNANKKPMKISRN